MSFWLLWKYLFSGFVSSQSNLTTLLFILFAEASNSKKESIIVAHYLVGDSNTAVPS
jgi:hypothetical protein